MMEFYDVGASDLRELWESYLSEPAQGLGQDVLMATREEEWSNVLFLRDKSSNGVVLRDRLMTDAALGGPKPIKTEHNYSLLTCSAPLSPATPTGNPHTPNSSGSSVENVVAGASSVVTTSRITSPSSTINNAAIDRKPLDIRSRIDDMEEECFPAISMNTASGRGGVLSPCPSPSPTPTSSSSPSPSSSHSPSPSASTTSSDGNVLLKRINLLPEEAESLTIKDEPISAPSSPSTSARLDFSMADDKIAITMVSPHSLRIGKSQVAQMTDSEEDDEEYRSIEMEYDEADCGGAEASVHASRQSLLPTPPSSASSDSESTVSASCSPERRDSQPSQTPIHVQNLRGFITPRLYISNNVHAHTTRQPIHTPLISCQPKGSTGVLLLTEEEKRTLIAEGYPVPTKLPLTKQEEKSLKKVRRKIKNKISAQESRRKKKEYMDGLERRVTMLMNENSSYRDRLSTLEDTNRELLKELQRLQGLLQLQTS
ncbi:cyclic AMP response element-binding protein A-like [Prorops nasuta]|uniref:cyclic AMP response element-binding protein A-like n=1 Tax=Prorops nasuta TaxID=863751 RepID=UPI0034CD8F8B